MSKVTIPQLHEMKRAGDKIFGVVAWDTHMAAIADRVGVEIVSVGDTVGKNLWGHETIMEITMDEMITVTRAARRGVTNALLSADFPFGPLQEGVDAAVAAAIRFVKEAGVDLIKLDGAADYPEAVEALTSCRHSSLGAVWPDAANGARDGHPIRKSGRRRRGCCG